MHTAITSFHARVHFRGRAIVINGGVEVRVIRERKASLHSGHYVVDATGKVGPSLIEVCRLSWHVGEPGFDCWSVLSHG